MKTISYIEICVQNPTSRNGKSKLTSAITQTQIPGQVEENLWRPVRLHFPPPLGANIELGQSLGYAKVENVLIRETSKNVVICIQLEDDYRNHLEEYMQGTWQREDTQNIQNWVQSQEVST